MRSHADLLRFAAQNTQATSPASTAHASGAASAPSLPAHAPAPASHGSLRLADLSHDQILQMIQQAQTDPFMANEVMLLQKQVFEGVNKAVQGMVGTLGTLEAPGQQMQGMQMSVVALASMAREREASGRVKLEFARDLIIGALLHADDPNWNIFDEAALPPDAKNKNGILALLQMPPPAASLAPPPRR